MLIEEPLPPHSITAAWPRTIAWDASRKASKLETPPSTIELFGPRASMAMPMWQAAMLGRYLSIQSGNRFFITCSAHSS